MSFEPWQDKVWVVGDIMQHDRWVANRYAMGEFGVLQPYSAGTPTECHNAALAMVIANTAIRNMIGA